MNCDQTENHAEKGILYAYTLWERAFSQVAAVSVLGGIGFTMSIFIAELGFSGQPEYLLMAKTGVLAASLLAGMLGFVWLCWLGRNKNE